MVPRTAGETVTELKASYGLAGCVESLNVISLQRTDLPDTLLIGFRGAKVVLPGDCDLPAAVLRTHAWPCPPQAVLVCYEPEAGELAVLDMYSFEHDAIGAGSSVRAKPPEVCFLRGKAQLFSPQWGGP
jgi:hypothetical protein